MMTMLKRIVSVMVSCVFISMVCIPAAHADDATGSIDLNITPSQNDDVQPLNGNGIVNGNGMKKQRSMEDDKCYRNATYHVKYETWNGLKRGMLTYGVYILNYQTCKPIKGAEVKILSKALKTTDENGYVEITDRSRYISDEENTWNEVYMPIGVFPLEHYYTPESSNNNVNCMVSERNEVKDCKGNTLSYNYYYIDSNGLIGAILLPPDPSDPPEPVLTSFPMTGKYTLLIVISMIVIAGITIIFIRRYGRK